MSDNPNIGSNPTERVIRQEETVIRTTDQNLQGKQSPMMQTQQQSSASQASSAPRPSQQSPGEIDASKVGTRQFAPINKNVQVPRQPVASQQGVQQQQQQPQGVQPIAASGVQQQEASQTQQLQGQQTGQQLREETIDKNPFNLMVRDHAAILAMVRDWLNKDPFDLRSIELLRNDISRAINIHNTIEDMFIHPLYERYIGAGLGVDLLERSRRDDELIMNCLRKFENMDLATRQGFESTLEIVRELENVLLSHFDEEEREAFPALMNVLRTDELVDIFDNIMNKKDSLQDIKTPGTGTSSGVHGAHGTGHRGKQQMKDILDKTKEGVQRLFGNR